MLNLVVVVFYLELVAHRIVAPTINIIAL